MQINKRKSALKNSCRKHSFDDFLRNYPVKFSTPLDQLWDQADFDGNGYLDRMEAKDFLDQVVLVIQEDRRNNFDVMKFD